MPGINGFQFLEAYEKLPVIVQDTCSIMILSSSLDPEDHKKAADNRWVIDFVNKPLVKEKLNTILNSNFLTTATTYVNVLQLPHGSL